MSETVYVLGAGLSRCAGAPSQRDILHEIFAMRKSRADVKWKLFEKSRNTLHDFIHKVYAPINAKSKESVSLEDLFTSLDKAKMEQSGFAALAQKDIDEAHDALVYSIIYLFDRILWGHRPPFYDKLAQALLQKRIEAGQPNDPFALINLNWDIILDNAIDEAAGQHNSTKSDNSQEAGIDYCCYATHRLKPGSPMMLKSKGGFNLKMQKLHGSFNWVLCRTCGRLIYDIGFKITLLTFFDKIHCPYCGPGESLQNIFISPTLLKDLDNTHLRMVWHNAGIDLAEAKRIVFVGYSLPLADFELRYLLKKSIKCDAEITVVLKGPGPEYDVARNSYELFFGRQLKKVHDEGAVKFFASEFGFRCEHRDCLDQSWQ